MRVQHLYCEFNAGDRKVYATWLRGTLGAWALIVVLMAAVCTVLALDVSITPEQRIAPYQQSGVFP
jgi:hypothetical protein